MCQILTEMCSCISFRNTLLCYLSSSFSQSNFLFLIFSWQFSVRADILSPLYFTISDHWSLSSDNIPGRDSYSFRRLDTFWIQLHVIYAPFQECRSHCLESVTDFVATLSFALSHSSFFSQYLASALTLSLVYAYFESCLYIYFY